MIFVPLSAWLKPKARSVFVWFITVCARPLILTELILAAPEFHPFPGAVLVRVDPLKEDPEIFVKRTSSIVVMQPFSGALGEIIKVHCP